MDGLPIAERSGLAYASTATQLDVGGEERPVMHACGHDVHMTALVGTARRLTAARERWSGTVMLVGQPVSREVPPLEPAVVTVGAFQAGTKHNIIPEEARLQLTVRADSEETRARLLAGIPRIAEGIARAAGLPEDRLPIVEVSKESTSPTVNDPALAERVRAAIARQLGEGRLSDKAREAMTAEDFAYFVSTAHRVPGVYFFVGGTPQAALDAEKSGGPAVPSNHSSLFRIEPRESVATGVEAMTAAVLELLPAR